VTGECRETQTKVGKAAAPIMIEYCLIDGVNDGPHEAEELCRLLKGLPCLLNLIPFNPWPGSDFKTSSDERIHVFARVILKHRHESLRLTVRKSRGSDILAACGQLAVKSSMTARIPDFRVSPVGSVEKRTCSTSS